MTCPACNGTGRRCELCGAASDECRCGPYPDDEQHAHLAPCRDCAPPPEAPYGLIPSTPRHDLARKLPGWVRRRNRV